MANFLLIHGSWHGAWCWEKLVPLLQAQGHKVAAPDLPGHGGDRTPAWRTTLRSYAQCIRDAAKAMADPPVVVGHSMGGFAITEAAALFPGTFAGLVYLCAFVPQQGETLLRLALADRQSALPGGMQRGLISTTFRGESAKKCFYATSPVELCISATARLRPEPLFPALAKSTAPKGPVPPRAYIECLADQAITIGHQRMMYQRAGITHVTAMNTDHSPFFSDPATLANQLTEHASKFASSPQ